MFNSGDSKPPVPPSSPPGGSDENSFDPAMPRDLDESRLDTQGSEPNPDFFNFEGLRTLADIAREGSGLQTTPVVRFSEQEPILELEQILYSLEEFKQIESYRIAEILEYLRYLSPILTESLRDSDIEAIEIEAIARDFLLSFNELRVVVSDLVRDQSNERYFSSLAIDIEMRFADYFLEQALDTRDPDLVSFAYESHEGVERTRRESSVVDISTERCIQTENELPENLERALDGVYLKLEIAETNLTRTFADHHANFQNIDFLSIEPGDVYDLRVSLHRLRMAYATLADLQTQYLHVADLLLADNDQRQRVQIEKIGFIERNMNMYRSYTDLDRTLLTRADGLDYQIAQARNAVNESGELFLRIISELKEMGIERHSEIYRHYIESDRLTRRYMFATGMYRNLQMQQLSEFQVMRNDYMLDLQDAVDESRMSDCVDIIINIRSSEQLISSIMAEVLFDFYSDGELVDIVYHEESGRLVLSLGRSTDTQDILSLSGLRWELRSRFELANILSLPRIGSAEDISQNVFQILEDSYRVLNLLENEQRIIKTNAEELDTEIVELRLELNQDNAAYYRSFIQAVHIISEDQLGDSYDRDYEDRQAMLRAGMHPIIINASSFLTNESERAWLNNLPEHARVMRRESISGVREMNRQTGLRLFSDPDIRKELWGQYLFIRAGDLGDQGTVQNLLRDASYDREAAENIAISFRYLLEMNISDSARPYLIRHFLIRYLTPRDNYTRYTNMQNMQRIGPVILELTAEINRELQGRPMSVLDLNREVRRRAVNAYIGIQRAENAEARSRSGGFDRREIEDLFEEREREAGFWRGIERIIRYSRR